MQGQSRGVGVRKTQEAVRHRPVLGHGGLSRYPLDALCDEEQKKDSIETTPTGARKIVSASLVDGAANAA